MERIASSFTASLRELEARRTRGEQHWEAGTAFVLAANAFYFATLGVLYWHMRKRDPYHPVVLMQLYNVSCVVLAASSGTAIAVYKWRQPNASFVCNQRGAQLGDMSDGLLTWGIWCYYYQKYWEFTVCAIARFDPSQQGPRSPRSLVALYASRRRVAL